MVLEISRRDWLKGVMASAGLAAVGVPLDVVEAAAPAIAKPVARPISVECGDFWIRQNGIAHFIGKMTSIEMRFGYAEFFDGGIFAKFIPDNTVDVDVSIFPDMEGYNILHEILYERQLIEAVFGHESGSYVVSDAFLRNIQAQIGPHELMVHASVFGRRG